MNAVAPRLSEARLLPKSLHGSRGSPRRSKARSREAPSPQVLSPHRSCLVARARQSSSWSARSLPEHLLWSAAFAPESFGTLATLIPSAPGHFGTFDFFAAEGFHSAGLSAENAVAAAVVCHIAILVPVTSVAASS